MKAFITALALASSYALAAPAEQLVKRASVSDVRIIPIPSE
jgi:pectate lyase